jgi:hypothetical protein
MTNPNMVPPLNLEQRQALADFAKHMQANRRIFAETAQVAKRIHQEMINAPQWRIAETPKPEDAPEQQVWTIGPPKVNYVDHIQLMSEDEEEK